MSRTLCSPIIGMQAIQCPERYLRDTSTSKWVCPHPDVRTTIRLMICESIISAENPKYWLNDRRVVTLKWKCGLTNVPANFWLHSCDRLMGANLFWCTDDNLNDAFRPYNEYLIHFMSWRLIAWQFEATWCMQRLSNLLKINCLIYHDHRPRVHKIRCPAD